MIKNQNLQEKTGKKVEDLEKQIVFYVYKIKNIINNKVYIGKQKYSYKNYMGSGLLIKRAINKYGLVNFNKKILVKCCNEKEMNDKEKFYIAHYGSFAPKGYNISSGGNGGDTFSKNPKKEFIRNKMCRNRKGSKNIMFGKHHSLKTIKLISAHRKGVGKGKLPWNKGIKLSKKTKLKISLSMKGKNNPNIKEYYCLSPKGRLYTVNCGLNSFCKSKNIPFSIAYFYINKGIIPLPKRHHSLNRRNLTNWEIWT